MKDKIIEILKEFGVKAHAAKAHKISNNLWNETIERTATRIEEELSDEWVSGTPNNDGYYDALTSENKVFIALRKNNKWWGDEAQDGKVLFGLKDDFVTHYRSLPPTPKS